MELVLPVVFMLIMGFALLAYVVLDGFDLGIGLLLPLGNEDDKDMMIASIGPFWDANETWIVLGIGVLLIAFPEAYGVILTNLYLPVTIMLMGLILRGVAFDFRVKAGIAKKTMWNNIFFPGSLIASCAQGWTASLISFFTCWNKKNRVLIFPIHPVLQCCLPGSANLDIK